MNTITEHDIYNYWLCGCCNLNYNKLTGVLEYFKHPGEVFRTSGKALEDMKAKCREKGINITDRDVAAIDSSRNWNVIRKNMQYLNERGIKYITVLDEAYPYKLRHIYDPPVILYCKGIPFPENKKSIAVIGARNCSPYGREIGRYLAASIAKEGIIVLSGLARGVDSYAHMGALSVGGCTYAVLGCGIDICYPPENINLYMEIQDKGGIISEYGPGIKPLSYHFPMRNRIISALSDGILVVEAGEKSGSLITVDMGLDQGKNIYAVPGRITDKLSMGCNNLIKMGAKAVTSPADVLEDFFEYYSTDESGQHTMKGNLNKEEKTVYEILDMTPKHIEEIAELSNIPISRLMEHLLSLELKDLIRQSTKNYYIKNM